MYDRESSKARNKECRDIPLKLDKMVHGQRKLGGGINNRILSSEALRRMRDTVFGEIPSGESISMARSEI